MSRLNYTLKNIFWGINANVLQIILGFVSRTFFINWLGITYLGVNGLFTNVLAVLSFAELGIGSAITYSLYKPLTNGDTEMIKALMAFYKKAYRIIGLIVIVFGLLLIPFLHFIIKDGENVENLEIIYFLFLFNTSFSYFFIYKRTLLIADQKNYRLSNMLMVVNTVKTVLEIAIIILFKNYIAYLLVGNFIIIAQNFYINRSIDQLYPYIKERSSRKLKEYEYKTLTKNIKALVYHKLGEISIYQTDNILISSFISIATVGLLSNYSLIITSVNKLVNIVFDSAIAAFGNLLVTDTKEKTLRTFGTYNFINFWIYGFCTVAFIALIPSFITIWIGEDKLLDMMPFLLLCFNFYLTGQRIVVNNMKSVGGLFNDDKYVAIVQGISNLVIAIFLVKAIGLTGIFVANLISGIVPTIVRPIIIYRKLFDRSVISYFVTYVRNLAIVVSVSLLMYYVLAAVPRENLFLSFAIQLVLVLIIPNFIFLILTFRTTEFRECASILQKQIRRK